MVRALKRAPHAVGDITRAYFQSKSQRVHFERTPTPFGWVSALAAAGGALHKEGVGEAARLPLRCNRMDPRATAQKLNLLR